MMSSTSRSSSDESLRPSNETAILALSKNFVALLNLLAISSLSCAKGILSSSTTTIPYLLPLIITELFIGSAPYSLIIKFVLTSKYTDEGISVS